MVPPFATLFTGIRMSSVKQNASMWSQFFERWADSGHSLQGQIRQMMVSTILDGLLPVDSPIPSSREMAAHLGVARNTVVIAYQRRGLSRLA